MNTLWQSTVDEGRWRNGRRSGLKIRRGNSRVGSNPTRPMEIWPACGPFFIYLANEQQQVMNPLKKEVEKALWKAGVTPDAKCVIGVSGGPDSLALLHIVKDKMNPGCLVVGHLNHKLREEADAEALFVGKTAESWGIPFVVEAIDVNQLSKTQGLSIEEAARWARYAFLLKLAQDVSARFVFVAHNADDQVETIFLKLLRGTGLTGLRGMEASRLFPETEEIALVRPLLSVWRSAIEDYCEKHQLRPMLDASNKDLIYRRNYLRNEILPRLSALNPGFKEHVRQLGDSVQADENYLAYQTVQIWKEILLEARPGWLLLDRDKWKNLSLSMQRRTLRHAVTVLRVSGEDISFRTIDQAVQVAKFGSTGAQSVLPGNLILQLTYDGLLIKIDSEKILDNQPQLPSGEILALPVPGEVKLASGWRITAQIVQLNLASVQRNRDSWLAFVDIGEHEQLQVRSRKPGERIQPLGMDGRSLSLQDLMVNVKMPFELRQRWPLVTVKEKPVWLVGYHIDDRVKVSLDSQRVVLLSCKQDHNL